MKNPSIKIAVSVSMMIALNGCGSNLSGEYKPVGQAHFESMNFKSDGIAEVSFQGMISEVTYEVEDDAVRMSGGGQTSILKMDDNGCIVGGGILGTYCKD